MSPKKDKKNDYEKEFKLLSQKKFWSWFGVFIFSAVIIIMWGWAMKVNFTSFSWQKTEEKKVMDNVKSDWDNYIKQEKEEFEKMQAKKETRDKLMELAQMADATTTATSTATTTTSTVDTQINTSTTSSIYN